MPDRRNTGRIGKKRALVLCAASLLVALLLLVGAEGVLRLFGVAAGGSAERFQPPWMDDDTYRLWKDWVGRFDAPLADIADIGWEYDPVLRWSLKPGLSVDARNIFVDPSDEDAGQWHLETNEHGFRTPDYERSKRPGTVRIITLGDSNTMGWLLDEDRTYPRRLEAHLARKLGRPVELINLGVAGYTSFAALYLFREEALPLDPDAIVLSVGANDAQVMATGDAEFAATQGTAVIRSLGRRLGRLRLTLVLKRLLTPIEKPGVPRVTPAQFGENLSAVFREARSRDIPVVFAQICCCSTTYRAPLTESTTRFGIPVVEAVPILQQTFESPVERRRLATEIAEIESRYTAAELRANPGLLFYFRDFCHLNRLGADIVAERLADELTLVLR